MAKTTTDITLKSSSQEWYTPPPIAALAREVMGGITLDPASCAAANRNIQAERYYTIQDDGLLQSWDARALWLNPPYGRQTGRWLALLFEEYEAGRVGEAIALVGGNVDTRYVQAALPEYPVCFYRGRINFLSMNGTPGRNTRSSILIYLPPKDHPQQVARFLAVFGQVGYVSLPPQFYHFDPRIKPEKQFQEVQSA